jgi:hypothetical protein
MKLLQTITMSFFGPIQGRTEALTYVVTTGQMKLCDAIALKDHLYQFSAISEQLNKNLKLQIPYCSIEEPYISNQALYE